MNPTLPRWLSAVVVAALIATAMLAVPPPAQAEVRYTNVEQLAAGSFAEAGLAVSQRSYTPEGTAAVVLATEENFPDALTASALASSVGGPVLFTGRTALGQATSDEIDRLLDDGDTVYVMGGDTAVDPAVTTALEERYTVQRIAGDTRLETAVAAAQAVGITDRVLIARAFGPDGANTDSDRTTGWVDAISCGAYAAAEGIPMLLTQTDVLSVPTRDALGASGATEAIVCGGEVAVSAGVADELGALGLAVERYHGVTRVETAIDVARRLFGLPSARGNSYVLAPGYGENFGYGLAAAPLGLPILLVGSTEPTDCPDQSQPSRATLCYLESGSDDPASLLVVGGESIIPDPVVEAAAVAAGGTPLADVDVLTAPTGVEVVDDIDDDGTRLTVTWDAVEDPDGILAGYNVYVDGELVGEDPPTVDAGTTEHLIEGLTADEQVTVTVTATDIADRESEPSEGVTATPEDETPGAIEDFTARVGSNQVVLTWTRGPEDAASYTIQRATAEGETCGAYSELTTVSDPDTTTYTDTTATNGTAYCYRITVTDAAGQTSTPATVGPVTPEEPQLGIDIVNIEPEFTFHTGYPHVIQTKTTVPSGVALDSLQLVVEFIPDSASLPPIIIREGAHPATSAVETTFRAIEGQRAGINTDSARSEDYDDAVGTLRASVFTTTGTPADDEVDDVEIQRSPERVMGLQAVGGNDVVVLTWERSPEPTTTAYRIERASAQVTAQTDDPSVCTTQSLSYETIQEKSTTEPNAETYRDDGVENGSGPTDTRYCYRVRALRPAASGLDTADQTGEASAVDSANPDAASADLTIIDPAGGTVNERRSYPVKWTITVPEGGTATQTTTLEYCVDYRPSLVLPACRDADGWKAMRITGDTDNVVPSPVAAGQSQTFTAQWEVPNINQASGTTGAVRLRTQGGSDINDGISFR